MLQFMKEGGWGAWFVLVFSILALVGAGLFAWRPDVRKLRYLCGITVGAVFSSLCGVLSGFAATLHYVSDPQNGGSDWYRFLMTGLAESMGPPILGFGMLATAWLIASVGLRRLGVGA